MTAQVLQIPQNKAPIKIMKLHPKIEYLAGGSHGQCPGYVKRRVYSDLPKGESSAVLTENFYLEDYDR